ncbi:hypothetical protein [Nocardia sp. NPDC024068]|uniref:hypothetical protein n=1 Tax=Nocardia sp. NPDC024068 TaxID=3157197 RepID=UPI0033FC245F
MTIGALAVLTAWAPFADPDQLSALVVVGMGIAGYSGYRFAVAAGTLRYGPARPAPVPVRRVRQEYQLLSRSWLEIRDGGKTRWIPVYFTPELVGFTGGTAFLGDRRIVVRATAGPSGPAGGPDTAANPGTGSAETEPAGREVRSADPTGTGLRLLPAGRERDTEPPGRLIDNPTRVGPDIAARSTTVARIGRRLLLDAQTAVAAPFAGLLWVYVMGGGTGAFAGSAVVAAAAGIWLSAIRGSDPS